MFIIMYGTEWSRTVVTEGLQVKTRTKKEETSQYHPKRNACNIVLIASPYAAVRKRPMSIENWLNTIAQPNVGWARSVPGK
jgi:hypothetical protein